MAIDCLSKLYGWVITVVKEVFKFWVVWSGHEDFFLKHLGLCVLVPFGNCLLVSELGLMMECG